MFRPAQYSTGGLSPALPSLRVIFVGWALWFLAGCSTHQGITMRHNGGAPIAVAAGSHVLAQPNLSIVFAPLDRVRVQITRLASPETGQLLSPNDRVAYQLTNSGREYRIMRGDELRIHFGGDAKLELVRTVRPDGRITLSESGEIAAEGKTAAELATAINQAYRDRMSRPDAWVNVAKSNLAEAELNGETSIGADGLVSFPRLGTFAAAGVAPGELAGRVADAAAKTFGNKFVVQIARVPAPPAPGSLEVFDRTLLVSTNGLLAIPEIGAVDTTGKTVAAIEAEIAALLRSRYKNPLAVLVGIEASESRVVYVGGEVGRPGAYPVTPSMTLWKALTVAGGAADTGDLRQVILIRRTSERDCAVYVTNLRQFIDGGIVTNDLALRPQDIVVVPKTGVAKANLWVEQYITRMLPFTRHVGYSYNEGPTNLNTTTR